jgi:hypothetical protein
MLQTPSDPLRTRVNRSLSIYAHVDTELAGMGIGLHGLGRYRNVRRSAACDLILICWELLHRSQTRGGSVSRSK